MEYEFGAQYAEALQEEAKRLKGIADAIQKENHLPTNEFFLQKLHLIANELFNNGCKIANDNRYWDYDLWNEKSMGLYKSGLSQLEYHEAMLANKKKKRHK